ncbi:SDR family NAD(P)-dependent oxidoreductase [Rhizobium sp. G21]|uniref:SDR family NAD(P)-dependent oxidoreductase n=1 Tax=Rhizobium sp. G21 TaxID=2758439 RepID=UPI0028A78D7E|nr:SDR family NAD(P)-dependent oxidoreductase [Rhizobium sp. G21]
MPKSWTVDDMPSQQGRTMLVTGTGGLGFETALALARAGGEVILAGRDPAKGADAVRRIRNEASHASIAFEPVDLADLSSIEAMATRLKGRLDHLDVLINNAGVMTPPCARPPVTASNCSSGPIISGTSR